MFRCVCGHSQTDHPGDGPCRVPGCECEGFIPVPVASQRWPGDDTGPGTCGATVSRAAWPAALDEILDRAPGTQLSYTSQGWQIGDWAVVNRLMCDLLHRGKAPPMSWIRP